MPTLELSRGATIRALRQEHAWSIRVLARQSGLHPTAVWRLEHDMGGTIEHLQKIAHALGVTAGFLLGETAER